MTDSLTAIAATLVAARSALADGEAPTAVMYCAAARGALASANETARQLKISLVAVERELLRIGAIAALPEPQAAPTPTPQAPKRASGPIAAKDGGAGR